MRFFIGSLNKLLYTISVEAGPIQMSGSFIVFCRMFGLKGVVCYYLSHVLLHAVNWPSEDIWFCADLWACQCRLAYAFGLLSTFERFGSKVLEGEYFAFGSKLSECVCFLC